MRHFSLNKYAKINKLSLFKIYNFNVSYYGINFTHSFRRSLSNIFCEDRRCCLGDVSVFILGIQLGRSDVIITSKEES